MSSTFSKGKRFPDKTRKRSDYRRPSALGVPDAHFRKSSEYLSNYDKKNMARKSQNQPEEEQEIYSIKDNAVQLTRKSRPKTTLKARAPAGNGVSDLAEEFNKGSTNRTDYVNGLVMERRPLKARSKVDSMGPAEGLMETTTQTKSDYMARSHQKPLRTRAPRTSFKRPDSRMNIDWRTTKDQDYNMDRGAGIQWVQPTEPRGHMIQYSQLSPCLRPEGSMGFETESLPYGHNQSFDVSPPRVRKAKDKISLPEGQLEDKSETSSQYLGHENQPPNRGLRKRQATSSNLKLGTNSRKGSWSAKRNEHKTFIQGLTPKTKLAPAPDNIKPPEGNIDSQTESTDQYQRHSQVQRQKKVVINDGIDAPAGYIESQSETSNQYRARTAGTTKRRERLLRPPSNISRSLGDTEFYEQVAETIFLQGKPTQAIKASDNLKPSEDPMQDTSEHKNQYRDLDRNYYADRVSKIRPASSMKVDNRSGRDWSTVHGSDYFSQLPIYKKNPKKERTSYLLLPKGKFEGATIHREKYIHHQNSLEKASKLPRPTTSIQHKGDIDFNTTKGMEFKNYQIQKTWRIFDELSRRKSTFVMQSNPELNIIDKSTSYQREITQSKIPTKKPEKNPGPKTSLKSDGLDFKQGTLNQTEYNSDIQIQPREKPSKPKESKIIENGANFKQEVVNSTSKSAYKPPPVTKKINKKSKPSGNLKLRSKSADSSFFTENESQTSHDYKSGFDSNKPAKVRIGSTMRRPSGNVDDKTIYKETFDLKYSSMTDLRSKPAWFHDLTTPYGEFAEGQARPLGGASSITPIQVA